MPGTVTAETRILTAAELAVETSRLRMDLLQNGEDEDARKLLDQVEKRLSGNEGKYRERLIEMFKLNVAEAAALDLAVAVAVEPALGQTLEQIQGFPGRKLPSEIALRLLYGIGPELVVAGNSPLLGWGLIETIEFSPGEPICFRADPAVVDWYFGKLTAGFVPLKNAEKHDPLPEWQIAKHARHIKAIFKSGRPARVRIFGKPGMGRTAFAACLAEKLSKPAIVVGKDAIDCEKQQHLFLRLQRMALLGDLALIWRGHPGNWPSHYPVSMLQFIVTREDETVEPRDDIVDIPIRLPQLGRKTQRALIKKYLPGLAGDLDSFVGRARIRDLSDAAAQKLGSAEELRAFLRQRNSARTGNIGRIEPAEFDWDDLVLPENIMSTLRAYANEARERPKLLANDEKRRIFSTTSHLTALFAGPPGLGKSMSARVIARDLGLDLLSVDLSAVTSKYIGETAKNLSAAFEVARDAQCALMFEEADSLFSTRVKIETSNDRHANSDTGHLLQLMESHDVVCMLSTNKRANIDQAFMRRLRFIIEFKKPDIKERKLLWARMLDLLGMPTKHISIVVPDVAAAHEMTPAQIKSAALTAAYQARGAKREINISDIQSAVRIEFQKEGRLIRSVPNQNLRSG